MSTIAGMHVHLRSESLSTLPRNRCPLSVGICTHGRRKVLFGSNHPAFPPADCLADLDSLGLDEEARRLFLYENAMRVFRLAGA